MKEIIFTSVVVYTSSSPVIHRYKAWFPGQETKGELVGYRG